LPRSKQFQESGMMYEGQISRVSLAESIAQDPPSGRWDHGKHFDMFRGADPLYQLVGAPNTLMRCIVFFYRRTVPARQCPFTKTL
jgi:hypothetical protein